MIYLVEDDDNIRKLVGYALTREGFDVRGFSEPLGFYSALVKKIPDLVLLDIMLPGEDGLSILKKLRRGSDTQNIPVIMLTAKGSEFDKVTGLDMGADDYIAKPFGMTELISRINAVLRRFRRTAPTDEIIYTSGGLYVNHSKHIVKVDGAAVNLSLKEYSLLITLFEADGKVVERDTLLLKVWGEFYTESRTLDVHIRKLRAKLGSAGTLIKTVKGIGYRLCGTENE